jgi:hypothetical protein
LLQLSPDSAFYRRLNAATAAQCLTPSIPRCVNGRHTDRLISEEAVTRRPFEANHEQFALWNPKRAPLFRDVRRVVIAHRDPMIGESFVLLLGLKGMAAQHVTTLEALAGLIDTWRPQALMIDTRLTLAGNTGFVRTLSLDSAHIRTLLLAMSNFLPEDVVKDLQAAGYDGHCRRPCAMWQVSELLSEFFSSAAPR